MQPTSNDTPRIVCAHLLNDLSGSPRVLSQMIQALVANGHQVDLHTAASNEPGFLSDLPGVRTCAFPYRWHQNKGRTLWRWIRSQWILFRQLWQYRNENVVIYMNTVLPFGAALAGKLMGKRVVCHVHETSIRPAILKRTLFALVRWAASDVVYVSRYLAKAEALPGVRKHVIYNGLSTDFVRKAAEAEPALAAFTVLMLASLKAYKGIWEFVALAKNLPKVRFELVVNATHAELSDFFSEALLPDNLDLYPRQRNVHPFYERAHLVVNLSRPDQWVETFGLTALEAMAYGRPVIVPPVGGIAEIVASGREGYHVDCRDLKGLVRRVRQIANDPQLYQELARYARMKSRQFSVAHMAMDLSRVLGVDLSPDWIASQIESIPSTKKSNKALSIN